MNAKAIALLAGGLVAAGGVGTAIGDLGSDDSERERAFSEVEVRKDDGSDDVELVDDEDGGRGDGSDRGGGDERSRDRSVQTNGPEQDPNTGSGDRTAGTAPSAGTGWSGNTGDGDATAGNDGTAGGDNSYVAQDDSYAAPAPAPAAPAYYADDDSGSYGGGSDG